MIIKVTLRGGASKFVMVVVPGDAKFNSKKVKQACDAKDLRFLPPNCEVSELTDGVQVGEFHRLRVCLTPNVLRSPSQSKRPDCF